MNPDTRPGYRLVPWNEPTYPPDLHEYITDTNDLCKSGQARSQPQTRPRFPPRADGGHGRRPWAW